MNMSPTVWPGTIEAMVHSVEVEAFDGRLNF